VINQLADMILRDRCCPHCGKIMGIAPAKNGSKSDTVTLQHYENGTVGVLCHSCNTSDGLRGTPLRGAVRKVVMPCVADTSR
jgi:hypothetical protein